MPTLAQAISILKVDGKTFKEPEGLTSTHKLKKELKKEISTNELIKNIASKANFRIGYQVVTVDKTPSSDIFIKTLLGELDNPKYNEYAPWDTAFKNFKRIITFRK